MKQVALALAGVLVLAAAARAGQKPDRPRPELWQEYPCLKKQLDTALAGMADYLKSLEPESFHANYGELGSLALSKDPVRRKRAIRAIGALRDPSGLPILVAAMEKSGAGREADLDPLMVLAGWVYDAYHDNGRRPPKKLQPLLPLFVNRLVRAGDEPNIRSYCFQAAGALAGSEWAPLIDALAASRHPAVTRWSAWAMKQLEGRLQLWPPEPITLEFKPAERAKKTVYQLSAAELWRIKRAIQKVVKNRPEPPADLQVRFSEGIAHFDGWLPVPGSVRADPPGEGAFDRWAFRGRRVAKVDLIVGHEVKPLYRIWQDGRGAPVLCLNCDPTAVRCYAWGEYDKRGLLRRVVHLSRDFQVVRVSVFVNGDGYEWTVHYTFGPKGRLLWRTRYVNNEILLLGPKPGPERRVNAGSRRSWIERLRRYDLASIYPIPRCP